MKAILIDDEQLALDYLELQIKKVSTLDIVEKYIHFNIKENKKILREIDIVFLDIEMPEKNGLELAEMMLEENPSLFIIFVTAYKNYAVQAFELHVLDYLLKPVQLERLQSTLYRIENKTKKYMQTPDHKMLKINVCKELTFQWEKDEPFRMKWRTAKAKELFLYLLHHQGETVHKSEIIELLWPEFDPEKAYAQLYTTIYHIRKTLFSYSEYFSLKNMQEGYHLFVSNVSTDIYEWENKAKNAPHINIHTIKEHEAIMKLYAGSYLEDYNYLWAESERHRLEQIWLKQAYHIANYFYEHRDIEKAEAWYLSICSLRPEDEEAHLFLLKLYASMGYGLLVNHQYEQLQRAMEELQIEISPHIQSWYEQWKKNNVN